MKGLLILGMHRSGTSALAGQCATLGFSFGRNLLPSQSDNPKGFYEDMGFTAANDLLATLLFGGWNSPVAWDDAVQLLPIDDPRLVKIARSAGKIIHTLAKKKRPWAVKDPRLSRLLPLWWPVLRSMNLDAGIVMAIRRPTEVAASLERRNGLSTTTSQLLWMRHVAEPLVYALEHKLKVGIISYDALISSPELLTELLQAIGLDVQSQGTTFVDATLRHHVDVSPRSKNVLTKACERLYDIAMSLPVFSSEAVSAADADTIRAARDISLEPYLKDLYLDAMGLLPEANAHQAKSKAVSRSGRKRLTPAMKVANLDKQLADLHKQIANRDTQIVSLHKHVTSLDEQTRNLRNKTDDLEKQLENRIKALDKYFELATRLQGTANCADTEMQASAALRAFAGSTATADITVKEFSELRQFADFTAERPDFFSAEKIQGAAIRIAQKGIYCNVFKELASPDALAIAGENYRETITYRGLNSRIRALHHVLEQATAAMPSDDLKIFAPETRSAYARFQQENNTKFVGAEHTTDSRVKELLLPVPVEDMHNLTFPDMSFRATFINDVFQRLPFLDKALRELARILMPGGRMVSTFPFDAASQRSTVQAKMEKTGKINYLMEPEYHSNPIGEKASLVFEIPGWDILRRTRAAGFRTATMQWVHSESCGMLTRDYGGHFVLLAEK